MQHSTRQTLIVGKIEKGIASPSRAVAEYIAVRKANIGNHNPVALQRAWDAMTKEDQEAMDALLLEAMRS